MLSSTGVVIAAELGLASSVSSLAGAAAADAASSSVELGSWLVSSVF